MAALNDLSPRHESVRPLVSGRIFHKPGLIDDEGEVTVADTEAFLRGFMAEFHIFNERVLSVLPQDG